MPAPRYVAQKVGDQYVLVPQGTTLNDGSKTPLWFLGGFLAVLALLQRGVTRAVLLSMATATFGIAGSFVGAKADRSGKSKVRSFQRGPSYPHEQSPMRPLQPPQDAVEESSMESFPASDPPARMTPTQVD